MLMLADGESVVVAEKPNGHREWWGLPPKLQVLDRVMPVWDATRVVRRVVDASPMLVYDSMLDADFRDAVRNHAVVRSLFAIRAAAEWIAAAARLRPYRKASTVGPLRLRDMPLRGEWVVLGKDWPNEVAFGAVGRFWAGETRWVNTGAGEFQTFDSPGFAKIGCSIYLRALTGGRTLVTYEVRTRATDHHSRRAFLRYWHFVAPFVGVVMTALVKTIERRATVRARVV
ncbi:MAG: hypothetical protein AB1762_10145 [Gemmatimonadota bacterium]